MPETFKDNNIELSTDFSAIKKYRIGIELTLQAHKDAITITSRIDKVLEEPMSKTLPKDIEARQKRNKADHEAIDAVQTKIANAIKAGFQGAISGVSCSFENKFYSYGGNYENSGPAQRLLLNITTDLNKKEREETLEKIRTKLKEITSDWRCFIRE
jgi:hypothetical protein